MRVDLFQPTDEGEARILMLIETFSRGNRTLEGRTKLAKLDFFIRYPAYLLRALEVRGVSAPSSLEPEGVPDVETRMVRYRYGPWDPSYYSILGRLIGKGLVVPIPAKHGINFRVTEKGRNIAKKIYAEPVWAETASRLELLLKHLNLQGTTLRKFIYKHFPEVTRASWGEIL